MPPLGCMLGARSDRSRPVARGGLRRVFAAASGHSACSEAEAAASQSVYFGSEELWTRINHDVEQG